MKKLIISCISICIVASICMICMETEVRPNPNANALVEPIGERNIIDIISETPLVLIGTIENIEPYGSTGADVITIKRQNTLKGEAEEVIHSYDVAKEIGVEEGETYLMFLERDFLTVYPEPRHTTHRKDAVLKIENGLLKENAIGSEWYLEQLPESVEEVIEYFKSIPMTMDTNQYKISEDILNVDATTIDSHDYVYKIRVTNIENEHPHAVNLEYVILENYKGKFSVTSKTMPSRVNWQKGKEYILFLDEYDGHIQLAAYNGAVICEDDELFEKAIDMLEKNN